MFWQIEWMQCLPKAGTVQDYVVQAGWRCTLTDQGQTASSYGSCSFGSPAEGEDDFTPFAQLTEQQVLSWVWASGVDKDATEAAVRTQLAALIHPPIVQPPLPWLHQPTR